MVDVPAPAARRPVVVVGEGALAAEWLSLLDRSSRLAAAAGVLSGDRLAEAMRDHPDAAFAVALPPRAALEAALALAAAGRAGVVMPPLHEALAEMADLPGAAGVRVAHGWTTLPGLRVLARLAGASPSGRLLLEVAGIPEGGDADLDEALVQAVALVRALFPGARATSARLDESVALDAELASATPSASWATRLRVRAGREPRLSARLETATATAEWSFADGAEEASLGTKRVVPRHVPPSAAVRALAQLLLDSLPGDGLREAAGAHALARDLRRLLPRMLPPGGRPLRASAAIGRARPADVLARIGLRGELPNGGPEPVRFRLVLLPQPLEYWSFRARLKPVTFLTVRPEDVDRTIAYFGDAHCERRDRKVLVGPQDEWVDRRGEGEERVELYISRDEALARRAAGLQESDPTGAVVELGELLGYPRCCVEAFARQEGRANNSRNRYETRARTVAPDGSTRSPWPWPLNNLHAALIPFYPCSYTCRPAEAWARATFEAMESGRDAALAGIPLPAKEVDRPASGERIRSTLARPVLYFDHDLQLAFDGEVSGGRLAYRSVAVEEAVADLLGPLAAALGLGDGLTFDDGALEVGRNGKRLFRLERTDPALGFLAPFGGDPVPSSPRD